MDHLQYAWQQTVLDAFLSDRADMAVKVRIAEQAISARLRDRCYVDSSEHIALEDGLRALKVLICEASAEAAEKSRVERDRTASIPRTPLTANAL